MYEYKLQALLPFMPVTAFYADIASLKAALHKYSCFPCNVYAYSGGSWIQLDKGEL